MTNVYNKAKLILSTSVQKGIFDMIIIGPLWFLNLILIGLNLILITFIGITENKINIDFVFKKNNIQKLILIKSEIPILNNITDRDIFNTIIPISQENKIFIFQPKNLVNIIYPPHQPSALPIQNNISLEKEILPPLQITLHGTIISDNPLENKVLIENTRTKEEKDYIIGDIIEDAQIIFINKYKVTFIRSNGQEESIYLNKLLKIEEESIANTNWKKVIQINENNIRVINLDLFNYKIKSLTSFIDQLGLITIFEKNIHIGCIIQNTGEGSLTEALGLEQNDIIISINDIPVNETYTRMKIYQLILDNKINPFFLISVNIKRDGLIFPLQFQLKKNVKKVISKTMGILKITETHKESI